MFRRNRGANEAAEPPPWQRVRRPDILGIIFCAFHLGAAGFYYYFRICTTLQGPAMEHPDYARYVLSVEILCTLSMILYSAQTLCKTNLEESKKKAFARANAAEPMSYGDYNVHFLVCAYKEDFEETVRPTLEAALRVQSYKGCHCHVYLCDDQPPPTEGEDNETWLSRNLAAKRAYCGPNSPVRRFSRPATERGVDQGRSFYISTRNPKSCNVNHAIEQIIRNAHGAVDETRLTNTEIFVILDSDQQVKPGFLQSTLQYFAMDRSIAMVITPQRFRQTVPGADVLNHINADYWDLLMPGLDGCGFISCPGTNFLVRGSALLAAKEGGEYFPTYTVTEDYALGMNIKAAGLHGVYVHEDLCKGDTPLRVVDSFIQRRRWAMGHFQIFLSKNNPLIKSGLGVGMRLLYCGSVYTYTMSVIATLTLAAVPLINLWLGWFPLTITRGFLITFCIYFLSVLALKYGRAAISSPCIHSKEMREMAFASCANSLFCMSFLYAALAALPYKVHFQVTPKTLGKETFWNCVKASCDSALNALWLNCFFFAFSVLTLFCTGVRLRESAGDPDGVSAFQTPVIICQIWVAYNTLPHVMLMIWAMLHVPAYTPQEKRRLEHAAIAQERHERAQNRADIAMTRLRKAQRQAGLHAPAPANVHAGQNGQAPNNAQAEPAAHDAANNDQDVEAQMDPPPRAARATRARIRADRLAEGVLVAACFLVQLLGTVLVLSIFGFAIKMVLWTPTTQTYCGLFPFYFTDAVSISRVPWTHHPNCRGVEPFVHTAHQP